MCWLPQCCGPACTVHPMHHNTVYSAPWHVHSAHTASAVSRAFEPFQQPNQSGSGCGLVLCFHVLERSRPQLNFCCLPTTQVLGLFAPQRILTTPSSMQVVMSGGVKLSPAVLYLCCGMPLMLPTPPWLLVHHCLLCLFWEGDYDATCRELQTTLACAGWCRFVLVCLEHQCSQVSALFLRALGAQQHSLFCAVLGSTFGSTSRCAAVVSMLVTLLVFAPEWCMVHQHKLSPHVVGFVLQHSIFHSLSVLVVPW